MNKSSARGFTLRRSKGFTLVEMLVSVALFSIVVVVSISTLLALVGANRKAEALESVMNNLNITIDSMVRNAREGTAYNGSGACNSNSDGVATDCDGGGAEFGFIPYGGNSTTEWIYQFICPVQEVNNTCPSGGYIERSEDSGHNWSVVTAPEVSITSMTFYVVGTKSGDTTQPKVVIVIEGIAGAGNVKATTTFHIQATAVQRVLDL